MSEEKKHEEKPKYDKAIKSTKDVVDDKLKDKPLDYGPENEYKLLYQQLVEDIPKKVNTLKLRLRKSVYNCLPEDMSSSKPEELDGLVDKVYSSTTQVVTDLIGLEAKNDDGKAELEEMIKYYIGNIDKKTLKKNFEEQLKHTGYIDPDDDIIRNNILSYPIKTYSQKRQKRVMGKIEEKLEDEKEFKQFQEMIKKLGATLNKPVEHEDIWRPDKAVDTWMKLEGIHKSLQKL